MAAQPPSNRDSPAIDLTRTVAGLRRRTSRWRAAGNSIGLVPTMGALHAGHLALVAEARAQRDRVVVSIFVNPAQFGAGEDLGSYPRREAQDRTALAALGVDLAFAPGTQEMYPQGFATQVSVSGVTEGLCGAHRPGHFQGVTTVVAKLLLQCLPDVAYFGEKDYQQLQAIRRMVRDLDIPVAIAAVPTVRERDGLALSSRNAHLSADERAIAVNLSAILKAIAETLSGGRSSVAAELARGRRALMRAGFDRVDYLEVRDAESLDPVEVVERPARALAAVHIGATRLIDNVPIAPPRTPKAC